MLSFEKQKNPAENQTETAAESPEKVQTESSEKTAAESPEKVQTESSEKIAAESLEKVQTESSEKTAAESPEMIQKADSKAKKKISLRQLTIFAMIAALMYATKIALQALPNVHLLAVFIAASTIVYRKKALYPLYTYVFIEGLFAGFAAWWLPYLYLWTILWAAVMFVTSFKKVTESRFFPLIIMITCALHGFAFGTLYAPAQALMYGLNFKAMIAWIIAGIPFDLIHGISNFCCSLLVMPFVRIMRRADNI